MLKIRNWLGLEKPSENRIFNQNLQKYKYWWQMLLFQRT